MTESLKELYTNDLDRLIAEVEKFENEEDLWRTSGDIINPAGNLALHIAGNLQHFFGATLGATGYVRDRDAEFGSKNIPKAEIINEINKAKEAVAGVLDHITSDQLQATFPHKVLNQEWKTEKFIIFLQGHLAYHLGQLNYLRRMLI